MKPYTEIFSKHMRAELRNARVLLHESRAALLIFFGVMVFGSLALWLFYVDPSSGARIDLINALPWSPYDTVDVWEYRSVSAPAAGPLTVVIEDVVVPRAEAVALPWPQFSQPGGVRNQMPPGDMPPAGQPVIGQPVPPAGQPVPPAGPLVPAGQPVPTAAV